MSATTDTIVAAAAIIANANAATGTTFASTMCCQCCWQLGSMHMSTVAMIQT